MKKVFSISIIVFLLLNCTKEIDLINKNEKQKDVVNCILSADSTMELVLYKSNLPLSTSNKFSLIKDAQVEISQANQKETLVFSGGDFIENGMAQGVYSSTKKVEEGKTYQLNISGNNIENLSSEVYIPLSPNIIKPEIVITPSDVELRFTINDPQEEENYYSIELVYTSNFFEYDGVDTTFYDSFTSSAYLFSKKDNSSFITFDDELSGEKVLFDDKLFLENNSQVKLFTYIENGVQEDGGFYYGNIITDAYIEVASIDKYLFRYEKSIQEQFASDADPFSEPVQVISNIENGIGIFGSKTSKKFDVSF